MFQLGSKSGNASLYNVRVSLQVEASFAALTSGDDKALLTRIREIKGLKQPGPQVMSPPPPTAIHFPGNISL